MFDEFDLKKSQRPTNPKPVKRSIKRSRASVNPLNKAKNIDENIYECDREFCLSYKTRKVNKKMNNKFEATITSNDVTIPFKDLIVKNCPEKNHIVTTIFACITDRESLLKINDFISKKINLFMDANDCLLKKINEEKYQQETFGFIQDVSLFSVKDYYDPQKGFFTTNAQINRMSYERDLINLKINAITYSSFDVNEIMDFILSHQIKNPKLKVDSKYVNVLSKNNSRLYLRELSSEAFKPLISDNYSDNVLQKFKTSVIQLNEKDPTGRILILQGPPGTGKTYMVRSLLGEIKESTIILIPPEFLSQLKSPEIIELIVDNAEGTGRPTILILEDADECLVPRGADNMNSISAILNYGDGIIGSIIDIRMICTTNAKIKEFDSAITRPGRLIDLINIDVLPYEKSNKRFNDLGGKGNLPKKDSYTIAEIYMLAKGQNIEALKEYNSVGFKNERLGL